MVRVRIQATPKETALIARAARKKGMTAAEFIHRAVEQPLSAKREPNRVQKLKPHRGAA